MRHLGQIEDQLDDPAPKDWEDAATEAVDDQVLESLGAVERAELRRFDTALHRVEIGSYGERVKCGEPIAEKRLVLLPETLHCAA